MVISSLVSQSLTGTSNIIVLKYRRPLTCSYLWIGHKDEHSSYKITLCFVFCQYSSVLMAKTRTQINSELLHSTFEILL